jgi:hypothetical protein
LPTENAGGIGVYRAQQQFVVVEEVFHVELKASGEAVGKFSWVGYDRAKLEKRVALNQSLDVQHAFRCAL